MSSCARISSSLAISIIFLFEPGAHERSVPIGFGGDRSICICIAPFAHARGALIDVGKAHASTRTFVVVVPIWFPVGWKFVTALFLFFLINYF